MQALRELRPDLTFEEECNLYNELLTNTTDAYDFDEEPPKEIDDMPEFEVGKYLINIDTGAVWKIQTLDDLETVVLGYRNGQRNIKIYI